jgi:sigma-B regulation protein RsbU (phosphoserine phosphatase)
VALLAIEIQASSLDEVSSLIRITARVIFAIFMFVIVVLAIAMSWWMSRPVLALSEGMDKVASGDLTARVSTGVRFDEFDALNRRFNRMVEGLAERERMQSSLSLASDVQARLLPRVEPEIAGYEFFRFVRYCDQLGGDYLDCFVIDKSSSPNAHDSTWAIAVGDVSGHGVPAALLMSWTRSLLRGIAPRVEPDPSSMLRVVNSELVRDADGTSFLTLFLGVLDPVTHSLCWSSGGHDPGIVLRASDRTTLRLASTGVPLGIDESSTFPAGTAIELNLGDILFVGTDGLSQCRDLQGRYFGFDRIEQLLRENAKAPLPEIGAHIMRAADKHAAHSKIDDDVAFVILRRRAVNS